MSKNWEYIAGILWPILTELAKKEGSTKEYGDVAPQIGLTNPRLVRLALGPIQEYCIHEKLPPLTALVVSKTTGEPGGGFKGGNIDKVYKFKWETEENPFAGFGPEDTTESFAQKIINDPSRVGDIYKLVKTRGIAQPIFRNILLKAYGKKCAMCGLAFKQALEAAHIIPWSECEDVALRISPKNGILLCANHHKFFDDGLMTVSKEYIIEYRGKSTGLNDYSKQATVMLNGKCLRLPKDKSLCPAPELLSKRFDKT